MNALQRLERLGRDLPEITVENQAGERLDVGQRPFELVGHETERIHVVEVDSLELGIGVDELGVDAAKLGIAALNRFLHAA